MGSNPLIVPATALTMFCCINAAWAGFVSGPIVSPVNGHTYQLETQSNWADAEVQSEAFGGHLATIRNDAEQQWVFQTFGNYSGVQRLLWIGFDDLAHPGTFVWTSGEPVTYTDWDPGEPNDAGGVEFYTAMYYPGFHNPGAWNDWSDRTSDPIGVPFAGVMEIVPEPSGLLLITSIVAGLALRRNRFKFAG